MAKETYSHGKRGLFRGKIDLFYGTPGIRVSARIDALYGKRGLFCGKKGLFHGKRGLFYDQKGLLMTKEAY